MQQTPLLRRVDFHHVIAKKKHPPYKPPKDHLNCDPSLELEEMIVEAKPLHKKKKRLAKQRSAQRENETESSLIKEFIVYNRYKELKKRAMEIKEIEWQHELELAMANSEVPNLQPVKEDENDQIQQSAGASRDAESIDYIDRTPSPRSSV